MMIAPPLDRERPRMRLISFRPLVRGSLRGFASVELPIGLVIKDVSVLIGKNGPFAALPSKPVLDREGRHVKSDGTKGQYAAILEWRDRNLSTRFSAAVVELVSAAHPDALDDRAAGQ